ncbi:MAG TPA: MlaD family protein [Solirubrobacteraceae bacterium]|jgi:virulence factor Mce-like protein|nr:MlaD family protein [Solirubrobacteraceae bacterium]
MGGRPISFKEVAVAAIFTLSCVLGILYAWNRFGGTLPLRPHGYVFHAEFDQAANLADNEDVRIAGVNVGRIVSVSPRNGLTDAKMELDKQYAPLASNAHAILRSKTLLGENFVEITPGSPSAPKLPENGYLPTSQIGTTQQIDQVLSMLNPQTRAALQEFTHNFASALSGQGTNLNAAIGNSAGAIEDLQQTVDILDQQGGDVQRLVSASASALHALGARGAALQTLVTAGDQVLSATAARNTQLTATINALPPLLAELKPTLSEVQSVAAVAAPTLRVLRPVAPLVAPALRETDVTAPILTTFFKDTPALVDSVRKGTPAATSLVGSAGAFANQLDPAARQLVPILQMIVAYDHDVVGDAANLAAATEGTYKVPSGGSAHYGRVLVNIVNEGIVGAPKPFGTARANPYPAPGRLATLQAFSCANTGNPTLVPVLPGAADAGAPPCRTAPPWTFQGATRSYPNVEPYVP